MNPDWLAISEHAAERWHQRTNSPGVGPLVAWNEAERRNVPTLHGDELRYHRASDTVLVAKDDVLVTVIGVASARPAIRRAIHGGNS